MFKKIQISNPNLIQQYRKNKLQNLLQTLLSRPPLLLRLVCCLHAQYNNIFRKRKLQNFGTGCNSWTRCFFVFFSSPVIFSVSEIIPRWPCACPSVVWLRTEISRTLIEVRLNTRAACNPQTQLIVKTGPYSGQWHSWI